MEAQSKPPTTKKQYGIMPRRRRRMGWSKSTKKRKTIENNTGVAIAQEKGVVYWKVKRVVNFKRQKKRILYQVEWENWEGTTWEPEEHLCDSALREARALVLAREEEQLVFECEEEETTTSGGNDRDSPTESSSSASSNNNNDPWNYTAREQFEYRTIERIRVDDPTATLRVREAREAGIPVVLTGHTGWAQFAKEWLTSVPPTSPLQAMHPASPLQAMQSTSPFVAQASPLLSPPRASPVQSSSIPVASPSRKPAPKCQDTSDDDLLDLSIPHTLDTDAMCADIGDEAVPIRRKRDQQSTNPNDRTISLRTFLHKCWAQPSSLYLHQWQFLVSSSKKTVSKLCNRNTALPILGGEDLLQYWCDKDRFQGDNPFQYLFMGRAGTMSNLHVDKGGLMITIAPIVGQKEVVLVHRADGPTSLYHLEADLNNPDLERYPLMTTARIWKSVIVPGEILIMPQGTYHQCRNITPCLSYSRFVLDTTNLKAFLESYLDDDAAEIDHLVVLWNACYELHTRVDAYVAQRRTESIESLPPSMFATIDSLRMLRNVACEISLRSPQANSRAEWCQMKEDIDVTIHNFRYRNHRHRPPLPRKQQPHQEQRPAVAVDSDDDSITSEGHYPRLTADQQARVLDDTVTLRIGDAVHVKWHGYYREAFVQAVCTDMAAAKVQYSHLQQHNIEYVTQSDLRTPGEAHAPLYRRRVGQIVYCNENGENYRATVLEWRTGTFYKVLVGDTVRWMHRESIVDKIESLSAIPPTISLESGSEEHSREEANVDLCSSSSNHEAV